MELSMVVVGSLLTGLGASYMVKYFDCVNPVAITTYRHTTACNHLTNKTDVKPETYTIIQCKLTQRLKGYSCTILRSSIVHDCGGFLHSKIAQPLEVEIPEPIPREDFRRLVDQQTFRTPDSKSHSVQPNTMNLFHSEDLGTITASEGGIACQG